MLGLSPFVSRFISQVLSEVRYTKVHAHIAYELEDHIESLKEDYVEKGLDEKAAYQRAVEQMGVASDIGKTLHKIHRPKLEWSVLLLIIGLITIGLITLFVCGDVVGSYGFFKKQLMCVLIGGAVFVGSYFCDYKKLERLSVIGYLVGILILIYGKYYGESVGSNKWMINIGPVVILSVVLATPLLISSFVGVIHRWGDHQPKSYWLLGGIALLPILIIVQQGISYGVVLGTTFLMLFTFHISLSERIKEKVKLLSILYGTILSCAILGIVWVMNYNVYMVERIKGLLYPASDPRGYGYLPSVMKEIRESATLIGNGGFQAIDIAYLPEPTNDVIFTFIIGSMGWLIGFIVLIVIAGIIIRMFQASLSITEGYGRLLNLGISSLFTIQFIYNTAMNLGYVPQTAISLPFVSYGGTSIIFNMALIGLFLSVYRKKDIILYESSHTVNLEEN